MGSATTTAASTTGAHNVRQRRGNPRGVSTLMYAAQQGDVQKVRKIIRTQPECLWDRDRTGKSPLHYTCTSDNIRAAQAADLMVMAAPELVESHDEDGFTPLHLAVIAGNMPLVTFLLANKADVNAVDNEKHTVVHWATVCCETGALRAVLAAGAPVSTPDVHGGYPLHYAAQMCGGERDPNLGLQVLQTLLTHTDIIVSVTDGDGRQPLLWAASAGSAKAILSLVRAGAAVEASDKDGLTALHCAASRGHTDCIDTLLTLCGASPDVIDSNGCTALHYAVTLGHADATAILLAHGADPNRQDRKGRSPAHCGCAKGQFETVKMIGSHGANLWLRNARGDLPLHEAASSGRRDLVKWLLEMRPSQVNARNNDGRCPLHLAALNDNADMCKILLDSGAQVNPILRTSKNIFMTPLDCALQRGFRSTAKYLQLHGGVPASRLGDQKHAQVASSGVNLHVRDDVTFWDDSSSDSERENGEHEKNHKRTYRKKLAYKTDKKKASLSSSDADSKLIRNKLETANSKRRLGERNKPGARIDSAVSAIDSTKAGKKSSASRLDYSNEIVINGKTEINIHQTNEIIIDTERVVQDEIKEKVASTLNIPYTETSKEEVVDRLKVSSEVQTDRLSSAERDKRPRSAKYRRVREKSTKSSKPGTASKTETPQSSVEKQDNQDKSGEPKKEIVLIDQSTNTSEDTGETVIDLYKTEQTDKEATSGKMTLPDQQSLMSNTSEDVEEYKDLVVEAAVHAPPKQYENVEKSADQMHEYDSKNGDTAEKLEGNEKNFKSSQLEHNLEEAKEKSEKPTEFAKELADKLTITKEDDVVSQKEITELTDETLTSTKVATNEEVEEKGETKLLDAVENHVEISRATEEVETSKSETDIEHKIVTGEIPNGDVVTSDIADELKDANSGKVSVDSVTDDTKISAETTEPLPIEGEYEEADKLEGTTTEVLKKNDIADETIIKTQEVADLIPQFIKEAPSVARGGIDEMKGAKDNGTDSTQKATDGTQQELQKTTVGPPVEADKQGEEESDEEDTTTIETTKEEQKIVVLRSDEKPKKKQNKISKKRKTDDTSEIEERKGSKVRGQIKSDKKLKPHKKEKKKSVDTPKSGKAPSKLKIPQTREEPDGHSQLQESSIDQRSSEEELYSSLPSETSSSSSTSKKTHKSFRVLDEQEAEEIDKIKSRTYPKSRKTRNATRKDVRSRSEETRKPCKDASKEHGVKLKRSKIPTPLFKTQLSRSEKYLDRLGQPAKKVQSGLDARVPSLPNIQNGKDYLKEPSRCESNMSAPPLASVYSDDERGSGSDVEEDKRSSAIRRKRVKKKARTRESRSAGSDYESSNLIDSGFEPSPRSSRIPKWRNMTDRGVNMTSVTQSIQANIRRYHLERKIFQHLLELKRNQIRTGQHNEAILVKRAIDNYNQSCASTVGAGRYIPEDFTFKSFEKFLYQALRKLQRNGAEYLRGLPELPTNPLLCTQSTHRCMHATHAYTGVPCAAYLPKMDHHTIPKIGYGACKPGTGFLPTINQKKAVTLELSHGTDKQVISLPTDRLDQNKRYYVTFTVKGHETSPPNEDSNSNSNAHRHSKSD